MEARAPYLTVPAPRPPSAPELAAALGAKRVGARWEARCPVHGHNGGDSDPSLSISEGRNGSAVFHCFAGCTQESVIELLRDLGHWPARTTPGATRPRPVRPAPAKPVAEVGGAPQERKRPTGDPDDSYPYSDAEGKIVAYHYRYSRPGGKKSMFWVTPDGFISNGEIKPERLPLYNLAALSAMAGAPVWVVEGEKAADALAEAGQCAVSFAGGASQADFGEALTALKGRRVALWPDNDAPGRGLMEKLGDKLKGVAREVRLVTVPGLPEKGDAYDYFAVAEVVYRYDPFAGTILAADVTPERVEWLWRGRLPKGKLVILDGDPGLGKSLITDDLAARVSTGRAMPGDPEGLTRPPGNVLILAGEDGLADTIIPRLIAAGADLKRVRIVDKRPDESGKTSGRTPQFPEDGDWIELLMREWRASLVVIDPVMSYLSGALSSKDDQHVRHALDPLGDAAERTGATVVMLRHLNKGDGKNPLYRGLSSIAFIAVSRVGMLVGKDPDDETGQRRVLAVSKINVGKAPSKSLAYHTVSSDPEDEDSPPVLVWEGESEHTAQTIIGEPPDEDERSQRDDASEFILAELEAGPVPAPDLMAAAKRAGHSERTIRRARRGLGARVEVLKEGFAKGGGWIWRLAVLADADGAEAPKAATSAPKAAKSPDTPTLAALEKSGSLNGSAARSGGLRLPTPPKAATPDGLGGAGSLRVPDGRCAHCPKPGAFEIEPGYRVCEKHRPGGRR